MNRRITEQQKEKKRDDPGLRARKIPKKVHDKACVEKYRNSCRYTKWKQHPHPVERIFRSFIKTQFTPAGRARSSKKRSKATCCYDRNFFVHVTKLPHHYNSTHTSMLPEAEQKLSTEIIRSSSPALANVIVKFA
jgi:hypothetical protein